MKRFLLSALLVVIGLSAFSQSPSILINFHSAYPLAIGEYSVGGYNLSNEDLYAQNILSDSLPSYEIGYIDAQHVRYSEDGYGFYLTADSLHAESVEYSYEISELPNGTIFFDGVTGRFVFYPAVEDFQPFVVTFSATDGSETLTEEVEFSMSPPTAFGSTVFQTAGVLPDAGDYTIVTETGKSMYLNHQDRTAYSVSIAGKDVVFDDAVQNKVWGLSGREDIYELNIYAERLIIRSGLSFPETDVTIYAKELIFEDTRGGTAYINTTPAKINTLADGEGINGADAGNITLNIRDFKSNMANRFILNGAKGQDTNRNGTPGNGGNGGSVTSTVDVSGYCDLAAGSAGAKYGVDSENATYLGSVLEYGKMGTRGKHELTCEPYAYLHPYYIAAVIRHANDAFINNHIDYALEICQEYRRLIDGFIGGSSEDTGEVHEGIIDDDDLGSQLGVRGMRQAPMLIDDMIEDSRREEKLELQSQLLDISSMLFKLEQGLDYFGNPAGWTPLLSFEVMLANYNNEIDRAIPTLYMYYWLHRIDQTLQHQMEACVFAANASEQELEANQNLLNSLVGEIPVVQDEAQAVTEMIEELTRRIEVLQNQLMARAIKNVKKRNFWKKLLGIGTTVASVIPLVGPIATGVKVASTAVSAAGKIGQVFGQNWDLSPVTTILDNVGTAQIDWSAMITDVKAAVSGFSLKGVSQNPKLLVSTCKSLASAVKPLNESVKKVSSVLTQSSAPNAEVQAEYNKLCASSPEWNAMRAQVDELNERKIELVNHMNQMFSDMTSTVADISNNVLALDAFQREVFTGNSKRDLNAMLYIEKMQQREKGRLLKYHYYLRKAYEYRLLQPYEGEFNLVRMFERFEKLGTALDSVVDVNAYQQLRSVFADVVSDMTDKIITEYSKNNPEQSAPITIVMSKDQLKAINTDGGLTLNFHDMGIFASSEENARIVDLGIQHMDTHVEGNVGYSGYMDLNMMHNGISEYRKDGKLYWFDHMPRKGTNPHRWGVRYDAVSNEQTAIRPSAASASLLSSLVDNSGNIMLFSRPSAWSDIKLSKDVHTAGGANVIIDSLVLRLQYDFTRQPNNISNIDITVNDGLQPYIACSTDDLSGLSGGYGKLCRSFAASNQSVTFTAVRKYGNYHFVNWTNKAGKVVSTATALTVDKSSDQFYMANYERRVPILDVPGTIKVSNQGGTYTVRVANSGKGGAEMDWYVSDSLSTWVHLSGDAEGIDEGTFTFTFDANEAGTYRVDSLEIVAPETDGIFKTIYIVQDVDVEQLPNVLFIDDMDVLPGQQLELPIQLKNIADVAGVSLAIELPEGMTFAKDGNNEIIYSLNTNRAKSNRFSVYWAEQQDGSYGFRIMPTSTQTISGTEGIVLKVAVKVDETIEKNDYYVLLKTNSLTIKDSSGKLSTMDLSDTRAILRVIDATLGDVNSDGRIDLTDAIMIVYSSLGVSQIGFVESAADVNGDGRIDLTDAIIVVYKSLGIEMNQAPRQREVEPE